MYSVFCKSLLQQRLQLCVQPSQIIAGRVRFIESIVKFYIARVLPYQNVDYYYCHRICITQTKT